MTTGDVRQDDKGGQGTLGRREISVEGDDGGPAGDEGFDVAGVGYVDSRHPLFGEGCRADDGVEGVGVAVLACGLEEVGGGEREFFRHGFDPEARQGPCQSGSVDLRMNDLD